MHRPRGWDPEVVRLAGVGLVVCAGDNEPEDDEGIGSPRLRSRELGWVVVVGMTHYYMRSLASSIWVPADPYGCLGTYLVKSRPKGASQQSGKRSGGSLYTKIRGRRPAGR